MVVTVSNASVFLNHRSPMFSSLHLSFASFPKHRNSCVTHALTQLLVLRTLLNWGLVLLLARHPDANWIYDLDSSLPFPTPASEYMTQAFHGGESIDERYRQ